MPTRLHHAARRLTDRLGVHGYGLLLAAFAWTLIGAGVFVAPGNGVLPHELIPAPIRLCLWWAPALLALSAAIEREGPRRDAFALGALVFAPSIRFVSHLWAWGVSLIPGGHSGHHLGWLSAAFYLIPIGLVALIAAIPDTPRHGRHP